ncbi:MAG: DUF6396 domain-containing protein [Pseudomonadota bacterium]
MKTDQKPELPRDQNLRLFQPHAADFACQVEAIKVPPFDAQAQAWFLEAIALEDPNSYIEAPDFKKIMQLTRQAAERRHWKAMLNLASFYVERRDPQHDASDAVQLVEDAMRMGVPAAYDRMGTYYMNGTGMNSDATKAYAFWQEAARMGNPQAMAFLADRLNAAPEWEKGEQWSNIPLAIKMFECAASQGYGKAAFDLHYLVRSRRDADGTIIEDTTETKARALRVLHEGVKFGCEDCANKLWVAFASPPDLSDMLAPFIDKARAERYSMLADAIGHNPYRRFPNLDRMVPLPPTQLPPWDGKRESLLAAVMSVSPEPAKPPAGASPQRQDRYFLDAAYALRQTSTQSGEAYAPWAGYWQPMSQSLSEQRAKLGQAPLPPALYKAGEAFAAFTNPIDDRGGALRGVVWQFWEVVRHNQGAVEPSAPAGLTRIVARPAVDVTSTGDKLCPAEGVWQPWLPDTHPMHGATNEHWRQSYIRKGEVFPQPKRDWMLDLPAAELTWHLMEAAK